MSQADAFQVTAPILAGDTTEQADEPLQKFIEPLKAMQEEVGQICELISEEKNYVAALFESMRRIMHSLRITIHVSPSALDVNSENVVKAIIDPTGQLMVLYKDERMELKNLSDEDNRDLLISVIKDAMPKLKLSASSYRQRIEARIRLISAATNELQKIAKALFTAFSK